MSNRKPSIGSKVVQRILLLVIVFSIVGSFFALYNQCLAGNTTGVSYLSISLSIIAIAAAIALFQSASENLERLTGCTTQLTECENNLMEMKRKERLQEEKAQRKGDDDPKQDSEQLAQNLIPTQSVESVEQFFDKLLINVGKEFGIVQGVAHTKQEDNRFVLTSTYAFFSEAEIPPFSEDETLPGQAAKSKKILNISPIPADYLTVVSGLGRGEAGSLLIIPILNLSGDECVAVIELASFSEFSPNMVEVFEVLRPRIAEQIENIGTSTHK